MMLLWDIHNIYNITACVGSAYHDHHQDTDTGSNIPNIALPHHSFLIKMKLEMFYQLPYLALRARGKHHSSQYGVGNAWENSFNPLELQFGGP